MPSVALLSVVIVGLATYVGGRQAQVRFAEAAAFAGSLGVGAALFEVIPDAAAALDRLSRLGLLVGVGFFGCFVGERLLGLHLREGGFGPSHAFHGLIDGLALGLSFKLGALTGVVVFLAVASHQFAHARASGRTKSGQSEFGAVGLRPEFVLNAAAPVLGTLVSTLLEPSEGKVALLVAVYGGVLLFAGVNDLRHAHLPRQVAFAAGGFVLVFAMALMHGM